METKFRGKDKETSEWVYGWYLEIGNKPYIRTFPDKGGVSWDHFIIPESVGQAIGSKDERGEDAYKGDIVVGTPLGMQIIGWNDFYLCWVFLNPEDETDWTEFTAETLSGCTIIGNRTDTPELLGNL